MLNLDTESIIQSHNITWLDEAYHNYIETKVLQKKEIDDDDYNSKEKNSGISKTN
jgi:hypothetical protein